MVKPPSRPARWAKAASDAVNAVQELLDLQQEYQDWLDSLPENLQNSPVGEKLQAIVDLDLSSASDTVGEADGIDLPQGFGRD